jgi:CHAT domain-containing protein/tetratricopeptide (TPR) repeat protein
VAQRAIISFSSAALLTLVAWHGYPAAQTPPATPPPSPVRALAAGSTPDRALPPGQSHEYELSLHRGDFVQITVNRKAIDLDVELVGPDGARRLQQHSAPSYFVEEVVVAIADADGRHLIRLHAPANGVPGGRYSIAVDGPRPPTPDDTTHFEAEQALQKARELAALSTRAAQEDALTQLDTSLGRFRQLGDRRRELTALLTLAFVQLQLGRRELLESSQRAEQLARDLGDDDARARALNGVGVALGNRGDLQAARTAFEEGAALARAVGDIRTEGIIINNEGIDYGRSGDSEQAIVRFERALALARSSRDKASEVNALGNLGVAYKNTGEFERALGFYTLALAEHRTRGDLNRQALVLNNLGNLEHLLAHEDRALAMHLEGLKLARQGGSKEDEARSLNTIGQTYYALGDYARALEYHRESLVIRRQIGDVFGEGASLAAEGRALNQLGDRESALATLGEALALRRSIRDRTGELETLHSLAIVERARGNVPAAIANVREAVDLEEALRSRLTSPELRGSFAAFQHDKYELLIDLLQHQRRAGGGDRHDAEALNIAERGRARVLLESLLDAHVDLQDGIDPALVDRERALQKRLNAASTQLSRTLAAAARGAQSVEASLPVDQLTFEYQQLQAEIRLRSPRYADLAQPQLLTAAEIQHDVLDDGTVLLEFALGNDRSWLWAVTQATLTSVELPPRRDIEAEARKLYDAVTARQRRRGERQEAYAQRVAAADAGIRQRAAALSDQLFGAVAGPLAGEWRGKRLAIVATESLEYVPFAALPSPAGPTGRSRGATSQAVLAADHEIVIVPSASVIAALRRETHARKPADRLLAIIADPVFEIGDPRVARAKGRAARAADTGLSPAPLTRSALDRVTLTRLPFSRDEARGISELAGTTGVSVATDFEANRTRVVGEALAGYRIVHFATHGLLDAERPSLSGLVLSTIDEHGTAQDGYVRLHDIYNMRLDADLVVLSACQTALGKAIKGEGLIGLTRAFMYAGAPRVVASLWEVDDFATAELMKRFYGGMLQRRLSAAAALRAAQMELSHDSRWAAPYYWAGFTIQGDWR